MKGELTSKVDDFNRRAAKTAAYKAIEDEKKKQELFKSEAQKKKEQGVKESKNNRRDGDKIAVENNLQKDEVILTNTNDNNKAMFVAGPEAAGTIGKMFRSNAAAGIEMSMDKIEEAAYNAQMRSLEIMQKMIQDTMYQTAMKAIADYEAAKTRGSDRALTDMMAQLMNNVPHTVDNEGIATPTELHELPSQTEVHEAPTPVDTMTEFDMDTLYTREIPVADAPAPKRKYTKRKGKAFVGEITAPTPEEIQAELKRELSLGLQATETVVTKKPRYAKPRVITCTVCGELGHNKRTCPTVVTK